MQKAHRKYAPPSFIHNKAYGRTICFSSIFTPGYSVDPELHFLSLQYVRKLRMFI